MPNAFAEAFVESARADPGDTLVALDIDGTVSEIAQSPAEATIDSQLRSTLEEIARRYQLWCISGRDADQALHVVGVAAAGYIGAHGLEVLDGEGLRPLSSAFVPTATLERTIRAVTADVPEAAPYVEHKRWSVAFHYRPFMKSDELVRRLRSSIETHLPPGLQLLPSKAVFEVRVHVNRDKGTALQWLVDRLRPRFVLVAGDDVTDLAMFRALAALPVDSLRVGIRGDDAPAALLSEANLVLDGVSELHRLLGTFLG